MGFYAKVICPRLIGLAMRHPEARRHRAKVVPEARGRVLEVGIGSALNLPFYSSEVSGLWGIDPSETLLRMARRQTREAPFPVELSLRTGEALGFDDHSFDTVVMTWVLCSTADPAATLTEIARVLKPGGAFLFAEHGLSPEAKVAAWQHRIDPAWTRIAGGCHLNRRIDALISAAGFSFDRLAAAYLGGPRPWTYTYEGRARFN